MYPELNTDRDPGYAEIADIRLKDRMPSQEMTHFLSSFVSKESCEAWLLTIKVSKMYSRFFAETSTDAFLIELNEVGMRVVNQFTGNGEEIELSNVQIIFEKWLEFLESNKPIEFSWETPVKKYVYDESIDAYVPAPE